MKNNKFFVLLLAFPFYLFSAMSFGAIIFQDNFDSNCSGDQCNVSSGTTGPDGWLQWMADGISATHDSVTKYSGEITSPGRDGSGKSLKLWRHSNSWVGSESYAGSLVLESPGSYSDFYMRFYAKMPAALNMNGGVGTKLWRFNLSGNELYVGINPTGDGWFRDASEIVLYAGTNTTLLNSSQLLSLWDGQWHAWQFRFNLTTGVVTFWADGVQISQVTVPSLSGSGTWNSYMQHFPMGNAQNDAWQSSWQAFEVDDLVIATTKAETDPEDAPLAAPTGFEIITQ